MGLLHYDNERYGLVFIMTKNALSFYYNNHRQYAYYSKISK